MVMIGRKWEELSHPNQYPVWNARILNVSSEEEVEVRILPKNVPYQARKVQEPENK